jgi:hypothetical protein
MAMRIDEAGHDHLAPHVDLAPAPVLPAHPHDPVAADGDVAGHEFARNEVEHPPALQHEIGDVRAAPLSDGAGEKGGVGHARLPETRGL